MGFYKLVTNEYEKDSIRQRNDLLLISTSKIWGKERKKSRNCSSISNSFLPTCGVGAKLKSLNPYVLFQHLVLGQDYYIIPLEQPFNDFKLLRLCSSFHSRLIKILQLFKGKSSPHSPCPTPISRTSESRKTPLCVISVQFCYILSQCWLPNL